MLDLYLLEPSARQWPCVSHWSVMHSGKRLNHCSHRLSANGVVARPNPTAWCSKASSGSCAPGHAGATCPESWALAPVCVGNDPNAGKPKGSGCGCGAPSSRSWMSEDAWIGARAFWTGVSLPPKRGLRRRENQARQGDEVDGGGRRPRCSFGKPTGQRLAGRGEVGRRDAPTDLGSRPRSGAPALASPARHCRPGLRQRSPALAVAPARQTPKRNRQR